MVNSTAITIPTVSKTKIMSKEIGLSHLVSLGEKIKFLKDIDESLFDLQKTPKY